MVNVIRAGNRLRNTKKVQRSCSCDETAPIEEKRSVSIQTSPNKTEMNTTGPMYRYFRSKKKTIMITDAFTEVRSRFRISGKVLGRGRFGIVRKCTERETNGKYAIKSIRKSRVQDMGNIKNEIKSLQELNHPNIIQLEDVYEDETYVHLVTELCTGGDLHDKVLDKWQMSDEGHFSEEYAAKILHSILNAIAYCHDVKRIVHCDLKPENIMFTTPDEDAPVKVIDFGLARRHTNFDDMTKRAGTSRYVAPEVLKGSYTKSCDIWSIGVIAYILLCGYAPFNGESDVVLFKSIIQGKFDFPTPDWGDVSCSAKDFICSLLTLDQAQRPTASEAMKHRWLRQYIETPQKNVNLLPRSHLLNRKRSLVNM